MWYNGVNLIFGGIMLEIIETLGVIAVTIVVVLIIVAIRLIGAIFEIRDTNNKIAEKLDEATAQLNEIKQKLS